MERKKVYLKEYIYEGAVEELRKYCDVVDCFDDIEKIEAIITRGEDINRDIISRAINLKVIGKHGVGVETIDLEAAKDYGVKVVFTPGCNSHSVAELSIGLMLDICRKITLSRTKVIEGEVDEIAPKEYQGIELAGRVIGYIGMGRVSQESLKILKNGFGMRAIGYDPFLDKDVFDSMGVEKKDEMDDVFKEADVIHVSIPLTDETRGLIGEKQISLMKPSAILINTSRGYIVDEKALYKAIKEKAIWGAASDVFDIEPIEKGNPLLLLDNFVGTPHIGACTEEAMIRMGSTVVKEVLTVLKGKEPRYRVV